MDDKQIAALRDLRLWHWRQAVYYRKHRRQHLIECRDQLAERYALLAEQHVSFVRTLDTFFSDSDTAEKDYVNQEN